MDIRRSFEELLSVYFALQPVIMPSNELLFPVMVVYDARSRKDTA